MKMAARLIPIFTMVLLVAALSASPVLANPGHDGSHGKGGGNDGSKGGGKDNGNGGGNDTTGTGLLFVDGEVNAYSVVTINGTGFAPDSQVQVKIQPVWCCIWGTVTTDRSGDFSLMTKTSGPGEYEVWALDPSSKKESVLAYMTFTVN